MLSVPIVHERFTWALVDGEYTPEGVAVMIPDPPGTGGIVSKTGELGMAVGWLAPAPAPSKALKKNPKALELFEFSVGKTNGLKIGFVKQASNRKKQMKIRKLIEANRTLTVLCRDPKSGKKVFDCSFIVSLPVPPSAIKLSFNGRSGTLNDRAACNLAFRLSSLHLAKKSVK
ncbi:hypothetical protein LEP1GSC050_2417 [Leptospira broomii serovar Hurstbridge str. 5399]|uniref:Uncharacterized protein n=1 Tax=Leptospira broomii serovar Hurstbridge str. 5399 TaxID=1049789 RepID=T0FD03_9LEPT|nr:hypothetical protein [Leptospira broomii]EQA45751.1 hypothetical protein LEP1GSC050_2417 [Leptospira broomii serovar Hurstbridge str. 5399]